MLIEANPSAGQVHQPPTVPIAPLALSRIAVQATRESNKLALDARERDDRDRAETKAHADDDQKSVDQRDANPQAVADAAAARHEGASDPARPFSNRIDIIV